LLRVLGLLCLFAVWLARADDAPTIIKETGKSVTVDFHDGRLAQAMFDPRAPLILKIPFQVTDNMCSNATGMKCAYQLPFGLARLALQWLKHPDPSYIGKVVRRKLKGVADAQPLPVEQFAFLENSERERFPLLTANFPPDSFTCADYTWLPPRTEGSPDAYHAARWDVELMFQNQETGLMENLTISLLVGADLKKVDDGSGYLVNSVRQYANQSFLLLNATLWAVIFKAPNEQYCATTLKPDASAVQSALTGYFGQAPKFVPYLYGADEMTLIAKDIFDPSKYDFEHYEYN
jgi:hypothetical protein